MNTEYDYDEVAPCIFVYENVIDNCKELIDLAFKEKNWYKGKIGQKMSTDLSHRNVEIHDIAPSFKNDKRWFELSQKIWNYGNNYGITNNIGFSSMEPAQFLWYKPSESFYNKHVDDGPGFPRIFSAVLYLNNVKNGGETHFTKFNVSIKPKKGRMVLFPSNYAYAHEAKNTKNQDKFAVVTWFTPALA